MEQLHTKELGYLEFIGMNVYAGGCWYLCDLAGCVGSASMLSACAYYVGRKIRRGSVIIVYTIGYGFFLFKSCAATKLTCSYPTVFIKSRGLYAPM